MMMKKQLLLLVMMLLPMVAMADAVEIDGIYYNLIPKGKAAEVTSNPNKYSGSVAIPDKISYEGTEYSVTSIGDNAFSDCSVLTSISIPNSVTSIGGGAFSGCSGLTSITIPDGLKSIGVHALSGCSGLTSITIPNSVTSIGNGAFSYCSGLTSITIGNSVTSIGDQSFWGCSGLISITIPNSVTSIGNYAFNECSGLTSITIPNSVTSIGSDAFSDCSGLTSITIPNSVTRIGDYAFHYCSGLTSVTIPNSVTSIGNGAFSGCSGLTSITIPNCVTSIGSWAFSNCSGLTSVTIPNSVTSIGEDAFNRCSSLTSITIPNSVMGIENYAFYGCTGLTSVNIGSGVKTIGGQAFASCAELTDVYCYAENVPSTNTNAFEGSYIEYATLHVPDVSINAYNQSEPWKNFKVIVGIDGFTPETQKCEKPTISYKTGQLKFASKTDGADFVTDITDADIKKHYNATISLSATYIISVYATKYGYDDSDVATATLCWIFQEPQTEGITDGVAQIPAKAVLIQSEGGIVKVEGIDDGTPVTIYTPDGKQAGSAVCRNGAALVGTSIQSGSTAIVKIGEKSVKVVIK